MSSLQKDPSNTFGYVLSTLGHLLLAAFSIYILHAASSNAFEQPEIYSVTIEGGESLGGVTQVPEKENIPAPKVKQLKVADESPEVEESEKETKLEKPSIVEDPEEAIKKIKLAEALKLKELEKKKEIERKKAEEAKKKKAQEEKRKAEEQKKKKEAEDAKKKAKQRIERDMMLKNALNKYKGESASAGGQGFGAARLGGKGMGGGTLQTMEFIAYKNQLEQHVKSGWHWLPGGVPLVAKILVTFLPTGVVQEAKVISSSGNSTFDESILRAVYKASPVPPSPEKYYDEYFREVVFTFDSTQ